MKRIGIYGGTFNPPHLGHLRAAQYGLDALKPEKILVIPTCIAPHKQMSSDAPTAAQRLEMAKRCFCEERLEASDLELRRGGASYTYETVEQVKTLYPNHELVLFMGTDMFLSLLEWKEPQRIFASASIAVFGRGEKNERAAILTQKEALEKLGVKVYLLQNPVTAISSTDLRRMLRFGCAEEFLAPEVLEYISGEKLYGTGEDLRGLSLEQLEAVAVSLLKKNRIAHVLGCKDTAVKLAEHWGADSTDAARAALLHDITKALDGPLQLTLCRAYGTMLDDFSAHNPKTLHALTGSLVAKRIFGENDAVVSAIRSHTTGKVNMNLLEKIIYVADYMEPNRSFEGVEVLRELAFRDIDGALRWGLETTVAMLREQGSEISGESMEALRWLKNGK